MIKKHNILVFPCGSEIALEIHRSLEHSIHFNLIGANSTSDHGKFIYKKYIGDIPFVSDVNFIPKIKAVIEKYKIDAIIPAMDSVITVLKNNEEALGCKVISSNKETTQICLSKTKTYNKLKNVINVPSSYANIEDIKNYPVFLKPDVGYGSRGVLKANTVVDVAHHLSNNPNSIILEYLPGPEYTIDCFTNYKGDLKFIGPRERRRISNGISVNTKTIPASEKFKKMALAINGAMKLNGAWFFQVKERLNGEIVLLEVASRLGGSSGIYRAKGINFASLTVFNAFEINTSILENNFEVEMDRALNNKYKLNISFNHVYVDFDDTILLDTKINSNLIGLLYGFINENKKVYLITKHEGDLFKTLKKYRILNIFDKIIHIKKNEDKSKYIYHKDAIFIDDSFSELKNIKEKLNIPVFSPNNIEALIN